MWFRWSLRLVIAAALFYVAWVFYNRAESRRQAQAAQDSQQLEKTQDELNRAGGNDLKITQFYANPTRIPKGQKSELCYGVIFAETVNITANPAGQPIESIWPSLQKCITIEPKADTEYTLTAKSKSGATTIQTVKVEIR
jgi:hypothetical protein